MKEEDRLKQILAEQLSLEEDELTQDLALDRLALDSLEVLELVVTLEEEFDIQLDDGEFRNCTVLGEIMDLILEKIRD
ncbi:MAG: phosphopantetheine-binding protein [Clostridiales bacterium]